MRRVQILLDDWHYQYLRNLAERKKTAISAELREIIAKEAKQALSSADPLFQAAGIAGEAENPGANSENIDDRLYRR